MAAEYVSYLRNDTVEVYVFFVEPGVSITFGSGVMSLEIASGTDRENLRWYEDYPHVEHTITTIEDAAYFLFIGGKSIEIRPYYEPYHISLTVRNVNGELRLVSELGSSAPPVTGPDQPSSWAKEFVDKAIAAGLVPQDLQSKYTQSATRAEFCAFAVALYENVKGEITQRSTFTDTDDVNVQKAAAVGVVTGVGDNKFDPNSQLTREQAAVMLSRLAEAVGKPLTKQTADFADNESVSSWAIDGVGQVQGAGIMGGTGDNMFSPKDPYTREQSITRIVRLYDIVK